MRKYIDHKNYRCNKNHCKTLLYSEKLEIVIRNTKNSIQIKKNQYKYVIIPEFNF